MRKPEEILLQIANLNHELVKSREYYNKERTLLVVRSFLYIEEIHYNIPEETDNMKEWVKQYIKKVIHNNAKPKTISDRRGEIYYGGIKVGSEMFNRMIEVYL